jgi:hypothetical protein
MDLYHHLNPQFTKWVMVERLLREPFVVIDIGCQGGPHPRWDFLGSVVGIHGFHPIGEVIEELHRASGGQTSSSVSACWKSYAAEAESP